MSCPKLLLFCLFIFLPVKLGVICIQQQGWRNTAFKERQQPKIQLLRRTPLAQMFPKTYLQMDMDGTDPGNPLFLSPLIDGGKIQDAQKASQVMYLGVKSYSAYITVNKSCGSNMYFWYFPPMNQDPDAPLIMWLQGGPGGPSIFGLFVEHGPYSVDKDGNGRNPFYVMGESYGGKYVPSVSYRIHLENRIRRRNKIKIPLAGMAIGDGFVDPPSMSAGYAPLLFQVGLLDEHQRDVMEEMMATAVMLERQGRYLDSFKSPEGQDYWQKFLKKPETRRMMHVGDQPLHSGSTVEEHMLNDFMQGAARWVEKLLDAGYRTLFYNGALDVIVGLPLTERLLWSNLDWNGKEEYRKAERKIWRISPGDKEVAGYARKAKNLFQVGVRNAGHILPFDQPERAFDMIDRFLNDKF